MKLTKRLLDEGYDVAGLTTSQHGKVKLNNIGVQAYIGNILEIDTIDTVIADFKPDIIMHEITGRVVLLLWLNHHLLHKQRQCFAIVFV